MLIDFIAEIPIGTLPASLVASPIGGDKKGVFIMFFSFNSTRDAAVSLAGAFLTAMLFVSAAVGPLPVA